MQEHTLSLNVFKVSLLLWQIYYWLFHSVCRGSVELLLPPDSCFSTTSAIASLPKRMLCQDRVYTFWQINCVFIIFCATLLQRSRNGNLGMMPIFCYQCSVTNVLLSQITMTCTHMMTTMYAGLCSLHFIFQCFRFKKARLQCTLPKVHLDY